MTLSAKLFLLTFLLVAVVIVGLYVKNQSLFQSGVNTIQNQGMPTTTPVQSDNPMGLPTDPETGTVMLPTGHQFPLFGIANSTAGGRLSSATACGLLQKVLGCYLEKAPELAQGYEQYSKGDLYPDSPPAVQESKCNAILMDLSEKTNKQSLQAGCIW